MKIFFYSHTLCPGGAEKQCALIASEIKKTFGYESVVILNNGQGAKPEYLKYLKDSGTELVVLPDGLLRRCWKLYALFRSDGNAVLFNYLTGPDCVGALMARLAGLRRVVGGIETDKLFGLKFVAERVVHTFFAAKTICNSYKAYDYFSSHGFRKDRLVVMPSAIEMSSEDDSRERPSDAPVRVVCIGRFCVEKDYITWVDTIAKAYERNKELVATIVGYGQLEGQVRSRIAERRLRNVISILPGQTTDVRRVLRDSDIYLSTSIQEGTSNTVLEAMDAALPIVATAVGDNERIVEDGASGYLCSPKDIDQLSEALNKLIENARLRRIFGARSREIVKQAYSLEKIALDYDKLIRGLQ